MSGGSKLKEGWSLAGDIVTPDPDFPFHVEIKKREQWELHQLFKSDKCAPWKWWDQTLGDCPPDKDPLMIFWKNRHPKFVMMLTETLPEEMNDAIYATASFKDECPEDDVVVFLLDELIKEKPGHWIE